MTWPYGSQILPNRVVGEVARDIYGEVEVGMFGLEIAVQAPKTISSQTFLSLATLTTAPRNRCIKLAQYRCRGNK